MAHWCRICGRHRPNEKFSGKGHRDHICKECSRKPKAERDVIDQEREICRYFEQKNISKKNLKRLSVLVGSPNLKISALADAVLQAGRAKPHRRKRLGFLARNHPNVMEKLGTVGLVIPPAEYRLMRFAEWGEYAAYLFDQNMDELHATGHDIIDPGEVENLMLEYSRMVNNET